MNFHPSKETHFSLFYNAFPSFVCVLFFTACLLSSRCASRGYVGSLGDPFSSICSSEKLSLCLFLFLHRTSKVFHMALPPLHVRTDLPRSQHTLNSFW